MNPFYSKIVIETSLRKRREQSKQGKPHSRYELAKAYRAFVIELKGYLKDAILLMTGVLSAAFGFKGFLLPNGFIDGGASGIALLLTSITGWHLAFLIALVNIPFIILGYRVIGSNFAFKAGLAIGGLALCVWLIQFPHITNDKLLVSIFGGFFLGAGIGLSVRGGAVIDGTEVLAIYLARKLGITLGDVILMINILIFSTAAYLLSLEVAMYSLITYIAASKTLDFVVEGIEEYMGVTIISTHSEEIIHFIKEKMGRGVTVYEGKKGIGRSGETKQREIVFTVITRLEMNKLKQEVEIIDPNAFLVMNSVKDIKGGMIKKRRYKH